MINKHQKAQYVWVEETCIKDSNGNSHVNSLWSLQSTFTIIFMERDRTDPKENKEMDSDMRGGKELKRNYWKQSNL